MSAFLGPIHYWLYNKIQIQQELVEDIITLSKQHNKELNLGGELDSRYGVSEKRPLEEVIDQSNIHGWLQSLVSQVEYKMAFGVTVLLERNPELFEEVKQLFYKKGKEKAFSLNEVNAPTVYKAISDSLLDGMPCDHANSVVEEDEDKVIWKRNTCVHQNYWDTIGGDISHYYILREEFIQGFLNSTNMEYVKIDDVTSMIKVKNK